MTCNAVLVVDSNVTVGARIVGLLGQQERPAVLTKNAAEAMAQIRRRQFAAVIIDVSIAGLYVLQFMQDQRRTTPTLVHCKEFMLKKTDADRGPPIDLRQINHYFGFATFQQKDPDDNVVGYVTRWLQSQEKMAA